MKREAPIILSPLDFMGIEGELILIEFDEENQINQAFADVIAFTPYLKEIEEIRCGALVCNKIEKAIIGIKAINQKIDFLIHRIDLFNHDRDKKSRGSLIKGQLSLLGPKTLQGRNVIITSCKEEYMLRDLCDRFIDVKMHE